jgi:hypothetical protein
LIWSRWSRILLTTSAKLCLDGCICEIEERLRGRISRLQIIGVEGVTLELGNCLAYSAEFATICGMKSQMARERAGFTMVNF